MPEVSLKVFKQDPALGKPPHYVRERVPYHPGMTVLMALQKLNEVDYVACRHSCCVGSCGVCAVRVNGRHALACLCVIKSPEEEIVIEPRKKRRILRDLITALEEG